jgi:hypothetical protein
MKLPKFTINVLAFARGTPENGKSIAKTAGGNALSLRVE